jgi:hypothetical protein
MANIVSLPQKVNRVARIDDAADFIATELLEQFDHRNIDSLMNRRVREGCAAYRNGLTNGERLIAIMRALSKAQLAINIEFAALDFPEDDEDGEAA